MKPKCDQTSIFYFFFLNPFMVSLRTFQHPFSKRSTPSVNICCSVRGNIKRNISHKAAFDNLLHFNDMLREWERKKMTLNKKVYKWLQNNCLPEEWSSIWAAYCQGILDSPWFLLITFPFFLGICQALQKVYKI